MTKPDALPWQEWIETLKRASETLPGWDQAAAFAAEVLQVAELKQRRSLESALAQLHGQAQVLESFFRTGTVLTWNVSSFSAQHAEHAASLSTDLYRALLAFQEIQNSAPATYPEWLRRQAEAEAIGSRIPPLY